MKTHSEQLDRRQFLNRAAQAAVAVAASAGLTPAVYGAETRPPVADSIPTRTLGKTGLKLPILGYGGAALPKVWLNPLSHEDRVALVRYAYDRGLRYFDTAGNYYESQAILGEGAAADTGPTMFTLPAARYAKELPFVPPEAPGCMYLGWLLPSAFDYDGLAHDAGVAPRIMYRVKYRPDSGITNFWTTPHRRAGEFEVCVACFADGQEAEKARRALDARLAATPGGKEGKIKGFHMAASGRALILESLPEPGGKALLEAYVKLRL